MLPGQSSVSSLNKAEACIIHTQFRKDKRRALQRHGRPAILPLVKARLASDKRKLVHVRLVYGVEFSPNYRSLVGDTVNLVHIIIHSAGQISYERSYVQIIHQATADSRRMWHNPMQGASVPYKSSILTRLPRFMGNIPPYACF